MKLLHHCSEQLAIQSAVVDSALAGENNVEGASLTSVSWVDVADSESRRRESHHQSDEGARGRLVPTSRFCVGRFFRAGVIGNPDRELAKTVGSRSQPVELVRFHFGRKCGHVLIQCDGRTQLLDAKRRNQILCRG